MRRSLSRSSADSSTLPQPSMRWRAVSRSAAIEEIAVEAALTGDPRLVYQAIAHDPLTAPVLSLSEIRQMTNEMFEQNRKYLPQFTCYSM